MPRIAFKSLMRLALASASVTKPCSCNKESLVAWRALPLSLELDRFEEVGTLFDDPYDEPTFAEFHPAGTRYDSDAAPIAPAFYPYNRCTVALPRLRQALLALQRSRWLFHGIAHPRPAARIDRRSAGWHLMVKCRQA